MATPVCGDVAAQAAARDQQFKEDRAFLAAIPNPGPAIKELLEAAKNYDGYQGDVPVKAPAGNTVVLEGLGTQLHNAAESYRLSQSTDNALIAYTQSYELLPDDLKARASTPGSLKGKSLADIQAALKQLNDLLAGKGNLDRARLEPTAIAPASSLSASALSPQAALRPGQGSDQNTACAAPTQLVARYWFPLKNFVSPVKDQGRRGTCWAFAAIGALESREQVQRDNSINLSEQFLVNKVKQDWDASDFSEGYWADQALNSAVDRGQALLGEAGWTYNPASMRPDVPDGSAGAYTSTCNPYGQGANGGTCSETAHQSRQYCTTVIFTYCGYAKVTFSGSGVQASRVYQVWHNSAVFDFNLNVYRQLLAQGYVLLADFPVYKGVMDDAANGFISNYARTHLEEVKDKNGNVIGTKEVSGSYGGHVVQIVGFISNEELTANHDTVDPRGGGYFIVKNSWGCNAGDGGYYYVPLSYVDSLFDSLYALSFDGTRGSRWAHEQQYPGSSDAPKITVKSGSVNVDLRVQTDLAQLFHVSHSVAKSVTLTVTSNRDGTLYSGGWNTASYTFPTPLPYTFTTQGARTLTLTASYGGSEGRASLNVNVVNSAPVLTLKGSGAAHQGEPYAVTAQVYDKNEAKSDTLCANTTWSVDVPDTLSGTTGCQVKVTFGETGTRTLRATTHDGEGSTGTDTLTLNVQPPPENPYPRIASAGMSSREFLSIGGTYICGTVNVPSGNTIDFDAKGCSLVLDPNAPAPKRYSAQVAVENPDNETLTYDWTVYVTMNGSESVLEQSLGSSSANFTPYSKGNAAQTTEACRITVTVNAPDPSRSKSLTVWTGMCTYYSTYIG
jgi:C1A family cysteine protease